MKMILFAISSLLISFSAFADLNNDIKVSVNGKIYQCSEGSGSESNLCLSKAQSAVARNNACLGAGYAATSCYSNSFNNKISDCVAWSEACNKTCKSAGYAATSCFSSCF